MLPTPLALMGLNCKESLSTRPPPLRSVERDRVKRAARLALRKYEQLASSLNLFLEIFKA